MQISIMSNFTFLKEHDPIFFELAKGAEQAFASDPNTTLIKLRQLGEAIAKDIAARCKIYFDEQTSQADLLHQIDQDLRLDPTIRNLFHTLRIKGNKATHEFKTEHKEALNGLKLARNLAVWYHQSFGKTGSKFNAGAFISPEDPSQNLRELQNQISKLRAKNEKLEDSQELVQLLTKQKLEYTSLAEQMDKEASSLAEKVTQQEATLEKQRQAFEGHIRLLQLELTEQITVNPQQLAKQQQTISQQIKEANQQVFLSEELARLIIDQQLNEVGWEADSIELTWDNGVRPEQGRNKAIGSYPIFYQNSPAYANYILFCGLTPIAVIEAKSENINVADKLRQAELYAKGFKIEPLMQAPWQLAERTTAWTNGGEDPYVIPFIYSSNGRPYNAQLEEKSGTWFRDVRAAHNLAKALQHFHTPEGLLEKLTHNASSAEKALKQITFDSLNLRDYQQAAIEAVEQSIANNQPLCLLAMATGTGKTVVIKALIQRFLITKRFKRLLILVDKAALGLQTQESLTKTTTEQQILFELYNLPALRQQLGNLLECVQLATIQTMLKNTLSSDIALPIDSFDCIIIDEAHSGYMLEQEIIAGEFANRDSTRYINEYNQLINYFDAIKIGLTATPVKHTTDLFGKPIFSYSYREAVADNYLVDYEPPIFYQTQLTKQGIQFPKGNIINIVNAQTGNIESTELEDELTIDTPSFSRFVINKSFNQIICEQLSQELDPFGKEKTLIFCASDLHADMVKNLLDNAFTDLYGAAYDQGAVAKITTASYNAEQLIMDFKNSQYPSIAITVDLLATSVDVPRICNLVFLRYVKSRILYEQMIGRATRCCEEIGKTVFRIYDPVGVYQSMEGAFTMQPLPQVKTPLTTLLKQFTDTKQLKQALQLPSNYSQKTMADDQLESIIQKLTYIVRPACYQAKADSQIQRKLEELEIAWHVAPHKLHHYLQALGAKKAADFIKNRKNFLSELQTLERLLTNSHYQIISEQPDKLLNRTQLYGQYNHPADYLESFKDFIKETVISSQLLNKTITSPNNITRAELKEIRLLLDSAGYSETNLQVAWRNHYHLIVDAGLLGYIRHAAIDEPLISFESRVEKAQQKVHCLYPWTPIQRQWLNRLAEHLIIKEVLDKKSIDKALVGYGASIDKLNKLLNGQLDNILNTFKVLWPIETPAEPNELPQNLVEELDTEIDSDKKSAISVEKQAKIPNQTFLQKLKQRLGFK